MRYSQHLAKTNSNSLSEMTMLNVGSSNLDQNWAVGDIVNLVVDGEYTTTLVACSLTVRLKLGSTVLSSLILPNALVVPTRAFSVSARILCREVGESGTLICGGGWTCEGGYVPFSVAEVTVDTAAMDRLNITSQWGGLAATIRSDIVSVW